MRPLVGLKLKRLFALAGLRRELTVSEPMLHQQGTRPSNHREFTGAKDRET